MQLVGDGLFARLAGLLGHPEWVDDPRFASDLSRGDHRDELVALITPWCAEQTTDEVLEAFDTAGVPSGPVLSPQQVLEHAHVASSPMIAPARYRGGVRILSAGDVPGPLGEHDVARWPRPQAGRRHRRDPERVGL